MKNGVRSFLKNLALFAPLALGIYVVLLCFLGSVLPGMLKNMSYPLGGYGHLHTRILEARETKNVDILFLGSSHAYRGFDTRLFEQAGLKSFNLGSSSQTPVQTQVLLKRYLENLNPGTVIYEVNPSSFTSDGVESALDIIANDKLDWNAVKMVWKSKNIRLINSLIFSGFRQITGADNNFSEEKSRGKDTYIIGGFVEMEVEFNQQLEHTDQLNLPQKQEQVQAFQETVNMLQNHNIKLILVQAPVTKVYYQSNKDFDHQMQKHAVYLDFNKRLPLHDTLHFYDHHHLNQHGVLIFNQAILKELSPLIKTHNR